LLTFSLSWFSFPGCTSLTDVSLQSIGYGAFRSRLTALDVSHVYQLTDGCLPALLRCKSLQELNMRKCLRLTDALWSVCKPFRTAAAAASSSGAPAPTVLRVLPLRKLDFSGCKLTDAGLKQLSHAWSKVATMTSTSASAPAIASATPLRLSITSLSLNECTNLTDTGLKQLLQLCAHLTSISLVGCHRVSDDILISMATLNRQCATVWHRCTRLPNVR
jgi:F-box and leucine-rich repeat protein GRR1